MFKKFYILNCSKDNVIHSFKQEANTGKAFELPLLKDEQGSNGRFSRLLLDFNFNDVVDFFGLERLLSDKMSAKLVLTQLESDTYEHNTEYDVEIFPIVSYWVEGGVFEEDFSVNGYSNWNYRAKGSAWTKPGGDFDESLSAICHLTDGGEDLSFDVSQIIKNYAQAISDGNTVNLNGLLIKYKDEALLGFNESKRFYSRHTHTIYNPKIFIQVNEPAIIDNRYKFITGVEQNLVFTNMIDNVLKPCDVEKVEIAINGTVNTDIVPVISNIRDGVFQAKFTINPDLFSATASFSDIWTLTNGKVINGKFNVFDGTDEDSMSVKMLSGTFNKSFVSRPFYENIGIATQYSREILFGSNELLKFLPYHKTNRGVDNAGFIFNNEIIYPDNLFVKFVDANMNYDWTDWMQLDLIADSYKLVLNTKSFRSGAEIKPIFKIDIWDTSVLIKSTEKDIIHIVKEY